MLKTCVVVADRARARLFVTVVPAPRSTGRASVELEELEALTDAEGQTTGAETFSSLRSGTNRSPHGAAFEYDDHRERHRDEVERRFARRIAAAVHQLLKQEGPRRLVLAIEPRLLGVLRQELGALPDDLTRVDLAKDLSWHDRGHILEALERAGALLPTPG